MVIERDPSSGDRAATQRYVRRARRVRARMGHDPLRMHRELRALDRRDDGASESGGRVRRVERRLSEQFPFQTHPGVAEAFAGEVGRAVEGGVLRYSRRAALLRRARSLGIGRFEANLMIATLLHRYGNVVGVADARDEDGGGWGGVIVVVAMVQAMIVGAVWWVVTA